MGTLRFAHPTFMAEFIDLLSHKRYFSTSNQKIACNINRYNKANNMVNMKNITKGPGICHLLVFIILLSCHSALATGNSPTNFDDNQGFKSDQAGEKGFEFNQLKTNDSDAAVPAFQIDILVLDDSTDKALSEISVIIRETAGNTDIKTINTDKNGRFQCDLLAGNYAIIIAADGYNKLEQTFEVSEESEKNITLRVVPMPTDSFLIVVRGKKESPEISGQQLDIEEARLIPGSNRDPLSYITNLPGISTMSLFNGYGTGLAIRGSSQEDSLFLVNNHSISDSSKTGELYHFGGFESIIEPELIESIDYIAGGFSAEYGDAMGGVIDINLKNPRTDRFGGFANLSFLSTSLMMEGPITEKDSIAFSLKRGFLDQYVKYAESFQEDGGISAEFIEYPNYYDGTAIYRHAISKHNDIKLIAIGKNDALEVKTDVDYVSERLSNAVQMEDKYISLIGEWNLKKGRFRSRFSPVVTVSSFDAYFGDRAFFRQSYNLYELKEKIDFRLNPTHSITAGIGLRINQANVESNSYSTPLEGEIYDKEYDTELRLNKEFTFFYPSLFLIDTIEIGRLNLIPGIHGIYDSHNRQTLIDPRFNLTYDLTDKTMLKGAAGLYSQKPQYEECVEPFGTEGIKPEKSIHGVFGVKHEFNDIISLDVQMYYKSFYDMVVHTDETDMTRFGNDGSGYAYGVEFMLKHRMTDHFFGWIAYTYSVSRRKDGPDKDERYFDSDIPHNLIAVANYKPNRYWSFGLKYQYTSGRAYTDLLNTETVYDVDTDTYYPIYNGPINEDRLDPHSQLDLRVDKYWYFGRFILDVYLDVRNVLQTKNVYQKVYNSDYTQSEDYLDFSSQVPMIFLGLQFAF